MQFVGQIKCTVKSFSPIIRSLSRSFLLDFLHKVICRQISLFFYHQFPMLEEKGFNLCLVAFPFPLQFPLG